MTDERLRELVSATQDSLREHMALVRELAVSLRTVVGFLDHDSLIDAGHDPMLREERERERQNAIRLLQQYADATWYRSRDNR